MREWQLGRASDQRRSIQPGQPVEVVKPPVTRRGRVGAERPASQEGGTVERHPALAQKLFKKIWQKNLRP